MSFVPVRQWHKSEVGLIIFWNKTNLLDTTERNFICFRDVEIQRSVCEAKGMIIGCNCVRHQSLRWLRGN